MLSQEMFHYSLVSGGREFQPVCLAIKWTIGQIISGSRTPPRNEASPPRSEDYCVCESLPGFCLPRLCGREGDPDPTYPVGRGRVARQAAGLLPMYLQ